MMITREEDGCRLLREQLGGTGTAVTTGGRTCFNEEKTDCGGKLHGPDSLSAVLKCRMETELQDFNVLSTPV